MGADVLKSPLRLFWTRPGTATITIQHRMLQLHLFLFQQMHAFIYRKASQLTFEQFKTLDKEIVDKIGHEEVGRKWKRMSAKKQFEVIHEAVSDPSEYQERLSATNFDNFLTLLSYFISGEATQTALLKKQLQVQLKLLSYADDSISDQLHCIHNKARAIGVSINNIADESLILVRENQSTSFDQLSTKQSPSRLVSSIAPPCSRLLCIYPMMNDNKDNQNPQEALLQKLQGPLSEFRRNRDYLHRSMDLPLER
jgi:hypothetical protein